MTTAGVLEFIKAHNLAVVATTDVHGKPEAAVVEFGELDNLTIVIDTFKTSRKYKNLLHNSNAALVIGWDNDITIQMNAIARELSGSELETAKSVYFTKNKQAKKWDNNPDISYFAFKPYWIRYSDVSKNPWVIEEFSL